MCQLTFSNLKDPFRNSLMIYLLGKNGSERHDDGTGFICSDNSIWKSRLAAKNITNLGDIINKFVAEDDKPVPFHIRSATWGIEVNDENAHPFLGKHFILMHNGTLLPRNGEESKDKKKDSDSLQFLNALDECRDINPNASFEEIFNGAMANFAGKFAFIIREVETNNNYIVRGRTAELWISTLAKDTTTVGYVINTSKETMKDSFTEFVNLYGLFFAETYKFSEPVLLKEETIFLAKHNELKEIGTAKEVTPIKKEEKKSIVPHRGAVPNDYVNWDNYADDIEIKKLLEKSVKLYEFLSEHSMGLIDFQLMVMISQGISILEITEEDLDLFMNQLIPKISANKNVKIEVKNILNGKLFPNEVYEKYNLEYPWTVNDGNSVVSALKDFYKEK